MRSLSDRLMSRSRPEGTGLGILFSTRREIGHLAESNSRQATVVPRELEGCGHGDNARDKELGPGALGVGFMASPDPSRETSLVGHSQVTETSLGVGQGQ